nr:hypothetical protein BaRGS_013126 [Batillaria attramentaria]
MSLLLLKTRDLTWQDHTLNTEVMLAPTRSGLLLNKHKTLGARCEMDKQLYERQRAQCLKDFLTGRRMIDRQRQRLVQRQRELDTKHDLHQYNYIRSGRHVQKKLNPFHPEITHALESVRFPDTLRTADDDDEDDDDESSDPKVTTQEPTLEEKVRVFLSDIENFSARTHSEREANREAWLAMTKRRRNDVAMPLVAKRYNTWQVDQAQLLAAFDDFCQNQTVEGLTRAMRIAAKMKASVKVTRNQSIVPSIATFKSTRAFKALLNRQAERATIEEHWHDLRETWTATCREVLGKKTRQHKEWLTSDTWDLITERKRLKDLINHTDDQDHKRDLQAQYWDVNRQVKRSARNDKRNFINDLTEEAETAAGQRNMKRLYEITRTLSGKNNNPTRPVKDKNGQIITKEEDQRTRWAEHFKETLNRPPPPVPPDIPPAAQLLDISTNPPTKTEIIKAIKSLKSGKAAGPDGIPPEALKADIQTSTDMLHPLLRKIWESESVPQDWNKGHLVKLPKKGDLSSCSNWRGIMLLSIPGKVLTRIILERLKTALDKTLREEQAGFRNDRSCTDHIATMRIIIEQSLEWQTPLYSTFVDFQKAFDSVDREVIWKLMSHYGFPPKFVNIIRQLYEDATCQVIHDGKLTEPFTVRTGVRQGCILSPTIFLMVVDWVMRQATDGKRTGIQWTFSKQLEDLDFADDIALLSHKQQDAQEKLNRVAEEAEKTGLKINISKTEVMRVNHKQHDPIQLHQEDIKEVDKFIYLGSVVSKDGKTDEDIKSRTNKARHAFRTLRPIWRSTALSLRNKIRIFNSNVKSVLLYGSETWRTTKTGSHRLQTFINRCLRNILNIKYPLVITNQDLWERTRQVPIEQEIKKRKWGWIGHTLRKSTSNVTRQSLDWNPQGKRKVGRPKQTWRRSTDAEAKAAGTTWAELKRASQNRVRWRSVVAALCSPGNKED